MNVSRINRLSEQHKELRNFHTACSTSTACNTSTMKLGISGPRGVDRQLSGVSTDLVIVSLRKSLLDQIHNIEELITVEVTGEQRA